MITKNPKVCKYFLVPFEKYTDPEYTRYKIESLERAFYGNGDHDYASGACGLLKQAKYPGYCQLCFVYHTDDSENFDNGNTVEFKPLVNEFGERILLKYDHDCTLCFLDRETPSRLNEEDSKPFYTLSFINNGWCDLYDEEKED